MSHGAKIGFGVHLDAFVPPLHGLLTAHLGDLQAFPTYPGSSPGCEWIVMYNIMWIVFMYVWIYYCACGIELVHVRVLHVIYSCTVFSLMQTVWCTWQARPRTVEVHYSIIQLASYTWSINCGEDLEKNLIQGHNWSTVIDGPRCKRLYVSNNGFATVLGCKAADQHVSRI